MKKTISTMMCLGAVIIALTSCSDDTEYRLAEAPAVTLSPSSVTLSSEGADGYTVNYTVSSPGEGASVSAAADVSWISGVDASVSGQVRFSVAANASDGLRTGTVTLTYSYDGGAVTAKAAVVQYGAGGPALSVDPNAVVADAAGGLYSFGYTLENPLDGEGINCTTEVDWISNFDYSEWGKVSFDVAESEEEGLRTATITVSYASLSKEVTVVQDHPGSGDGSDDGDGGGDGSLVGTYTAGGYAYAGSGVDAYTTWTIRIYKYDGSATCSAPNYSGGFDYYIDGLCPSAEGSYDYYGDHRVSAAAYVDAGGRLVVPTQVLNTTSSGYYVGWTPCTAFTSSGWSYNYGWPDLTFTYNASSGCWEADYGVFMGAFTTTSLTPGTNSGFYSFFDVVSPGAFQITKDGDLGDGGGDVDLSEFVGTYSCSGTVYNEDYSPYVSGSSPFAEATWTMKIYDHGDGQLLLSGLVPDTVDYYPYDTGDGKTYDNGPYTAYATVSGNNIRVSYPQWTGWSATISNTKYYICWVCCPATTGDSGEGWYYNTSSGTCTFTYDSAAGSWTSNVGLFLGLCSSDSSLTQQTFYSYYDVFAPGMTFTKTSGSTSTGAAPSSLKSLTERPTHTGAKASSAPASGIGLVTRSVGTLNMGDAKPSK